ncbi:MAG TPA: thioesterase family protein [bacterium]|nr:thioesterase family protein [bacterium]
MRTITTEFTVEWADCDPAGIVFYPRFYAFFDSASWNLFYTAGLTFEVIQQDFHAKGFPAVDVRARFLYPCRLKDQLICTSAITEWHEKAFIVSHTIHNGDIEAVKGEEVRIWGAAHPEDPKRLKAIPIPHEVRRRLEEG